MNAKTIIPIIASVGIGAAAYSMMTGRAGQLQNLFPQFTNMANQNAGGSSNTSTQ